MDTTAPPSEASRSRTFIEDLTFDYRPLEGGDGLVGSVTITTDHLLPDTDRVAVSMLATITDMFTGIPLTTPSEVSLTVDLGIRLLAPVGLGTYDVRSQVTKRGRTVSVTEATVSRDGRAVAHAVLTFVSFRLPEPMPAPSPDTRIGVGRLVGRPFHENVGVVVHGPGEASVIRQPYTMQPAGTIQGGVVSALVEAAGASILGGPVDELDVRFLSRVGVGPARATAVALDDRTARVTVVDAGVDPDRLTTMAIVRRG